MSPLAYLSKSPATSDRRSRRGRRTTAPWIRVLSRSLRKARSEQGAATLEFALSFIVFMFLVFAIFDFGHLFWVQMNVQSAIQEAARYGSTGQHMLAPGSTTNYLTRVQSIENTLENDAVGINIANSDIQISSNPGGAGSAGAPSTYLTVSATVRIPMLTTLIFRNGQYTYTSSVTVMNEPFPQSDTD